MELEPKFNQFYRIESPPGKCYEINKGYLDLLMEKRAEVSCKMHFISLITVVSTRN